MERENASGGHRLILIVVGGLLSGGDAHSVFLRDFANTNNNTVTLNSNIVISGGGGRVGLWDIYIYITYWYSRQCVYIYIVSLSEQV